MRHVPIICVWAIMIICVWAIIELTMLKKRINGTFTYIPRGIVFKNMVSQNVDKNTMRILKNKNSYGIIKIFSINLKDSIEYLPKDTILKTKTHEKIVGLMEKNKKIIIIKKRRNIFKHFLIIEKLRLNIHENLFEPQKFYNISFKVIE